MAEGEPAAYISAARRMGSASTLQISAARSTDHSATLALKASKFSQRVSTKAWSYRSLARIWLIIALMRLLSVPGLCLMWMSALDANQVSRGSQTMRWAPLRRAFFISSPTTGWASVGLAPIRNIVWTSLISPMALVIGEIKDVQTMFL